MDRRIDPCCGEFVTDGRLDVVDVLIALMLGEDRHGEFIIRLESALDSISQHGRRFLTALDPNEHAHGREFIPHAP